MAIDSITARSRLAGYLAWPTLALTLGTQLIVGADLPWKQSVLVVIPSSAVLVLLCHSSWYLAKAMPLRESTIPRLLLSHAAAATVITLLWVGAFWVSISLAEVLLGEPAAIAFDRQRPLLAGIGVLYYLLASAYHYLLLAMLASREAERRAAEARFLAQGSELKALKSQLSPHFLFNSLHSISALTTIDPAKARVMIILLAEFLRTTLGLGDRRSIALADELDLIRKFFTIEKLRFGDRLCFEEKVESAAAECAVPPLLLQPLVENAVKHGVASILGESRVTLTAAAANGKLRLALENQYDPEAAPALQTGVGLRNVQARLRAGYGGAASLRARPHNGVFRVDIVLPAEKERSSHGKSETHRRHRG